MALPRVPFAIALSCVLTLACASGPASTPAPSPGGQAQGDEPAARSTRAGVYSRAQETRGREVYLSLCTGCHTPASHTGPPFTTDWNGRRLSEMFAYLYETMPKSDPGSLSRQEYVDVMAYLLSLNSMPLGRDALPVDTVELKKIRFDAATTS